MLKIASLILPLTDNDGVKVSAAHSFLENELLNLFGGFTTCDTLGAWRDTDGTTYRDAGKEYRVAMLDHAKDRAAMPGFCDPSAPRESGFIQARYGRDTMKPPLSNTLQIGMYMHCALCLADLRERDLPISPSDYARLAMGWTPRGFQVWCERHSCNVLNIDFEGMKHPADTTRKR